MGIIILGLMIVIVCELKNVVKYCKKKNRDVLPSVSDVVWHIVSNVLVTSFCCSGLALGVSAVTSFIDFGDDLDYSIDVETVNSIVSFDDEYSITYIKEGYDSSETVDLSSLSCKNVKLIKSDRNEFLVYKSKRLPMDLCYSFGSTLLCSSEPVKVEVHLDEENFERVKQGDFYSQGIINLNKTV